MILRRTWLSFIPLNVPYKQPLAGTQVIDSFVWRKED